MNLLITDSGVGGLSVCAYAERYLRANPIGEDVTLTYVNASPENDFGYNSMKSRSEKLTNFDRFLHIVSKEYAPDAIYVACNTLSVLMHDTEFFKTRPIPITGIVEKGVDRLAHQLELAPDSVAVIFGTPTTIAEGTYADELNKRGIAETRVIGQSCPGLADIISEDRFGAIAHKTIDAFTQSALNRIKCPIDQALVYLACTHYGYRQSHFQQAFVDRNIAVKILNPNEFAAEDLFGKAKKATRQSAKRDGQIEVNFFCRYRIPETALETISFFLEDISPQTLRAFLDYTYVPDLF